MDGHGVLDNTSHLLLFCVYVKGDFAVSTETDWPEHPCSWSCASLGPKDDWISM